MESQDKIPQEAINKMEDDVKELAKLLNMFIFIKSANNHDLVRVIEHFKGIVLYNQAINDWFQKTLNDKFGVWVSQEEIEKERPKHEDSEYSEDESNSEKVILLEDTSSSDYSDDSLIFPVIPEVNEEKHEEKHEEEEKEVKIEKTEQEINLSIPRGGNRKTPFQSYRQELEKFQKGTYYKVWRHWASIIDLIDKKIMDELDFGMTYFFTTRVYERLVGPTTNFTEFKQNVTQASEKYQNIYEQLKANHPHIKEEFNELEREFIRFEKCLEDINV